MTTQLEATEAALAEANAKMYEAGLAADAALSLATTLEQALAGGDGTVTASELAEARQEAERAELLHQAAEAPVAKLSAAVADARADHLMDETLAALREHGDELTGALDRLQAVLVDVVRAAQDYDATATAASRTIPAVAGDSPRLHRRPGNSDYLDGVELVRSHAASHIARSVAPAVKAVGGGSFVLGDLQELARGARPLPTTGADR